MIKTLRRIASYCGLTIQERYKLRVIAKNIEYYRWHNIENNPTDLPDKDGRYLCYIDVVFDYIVEICEYSNGEWFNEYESGLNNVVSWKRIEPINGEE